MVYVPVPKDLTQIKSKIMFNLTKRQLICFGGSAFLIIICVAIYAVLVQTIATETDVVAAIWTCIGYTVLLCFSLFKSGGVAK